MHISVKDEGRHVIRLWIPLNRFFLQKIVNHYLDGDIKIKVGPFIHELRRFARHHPGFVLVDVQSGHDTHVRIRL